jgi:hypothetical protein
VRNETLSCVYRRPTGVLRPDLDIGFSLSPIVDYVLKNPVVTRDAEN